MMICKRAIKTVSGKTWLLLAALCLPAFTLKAQKMVLTGKVENYDSSAANFSYETFELLSTQKNQNVVFRKDGSFRTEIEASAPVKGFFTFGRVPVTYEYNIVQPDGRDSLTRLSTFDPRLVYVYLEPGDSIHMRVDAAEIEKTLRFSGTAPDNSMFVNADEFRFNNYLQKYMKNYFQPFTQEPETYKKSVLERKKEKMAFLKTYTAEHQVSPLLKDAYFWKYAAEQVTLLIYYPTVREGFIQDKVTVPNGYYDFLDTVATARVSADKGIGYFYFLDAYMRRQYERKGMDTESFISFIKKNLEERAAYEYMAFALGKDFNKELYDVFGSGNPYPEISALVREKYKKLEGMLAGNPAPKVVLHTPEGKTTSFTGYKGKYLYIDFWATWCGPCIKEIPSLIELEKDYEDKNIRFVSISFDKNKDIPKWKKYIRENEMAGIQLHANEENHGIISKSWNISMIPRFVILDEEGNIVDANAPRPSSKEIRKVFDKLVANFHAKTQGSKDARAVD